MWALLNGKFIDRETGAIRLENRGLTFGDGLFEVLRTRAGRILFFADHYRRLAASAQHLAIPLPFSEEEARSQALELIARNQVQDGELYLQLTRGDDPHRDHRFPPPDTAATFFMLAFTLRPIDPESWSRGVTVFTYPDLRHRLCEHKTLGLLPNVLAKNHAYERGGYEAMMFREDGAHRIVTEGGSSNYFCVRGAELLTPARENILPGITRQKVIALAGEQGIPVSERAVTVPEFLGAAEVFLVSTVSDVMPVRNIDGASVPAPGATTRRLMAAFAALQKRELGT